MSSGCFMSILRERFNAQEDRTPVGCDMDVGECCPARRARVHIHNSSIDRFMSQIGSCAAYARDGFYRTRRFESSAARSSGSMIFFRLARRNAGNPMGPSRWQTPSGPAGSTAMDTVASENPLVRTSKRRIAGCMLGRVAARFRGRVRVRAVETTPPVRGEKGIGMAD